MNLFAAAFELLTDPGLWSGPQGIWARILQHLGLTAVAVGLAAVIALPVGVLVGHNRRGGGVVGAVLGAARAIPTLGVLTLFGLVLGVGVAAPMVALIILAVPSLLAAAYAGIQAIDHTIPSAARAIGMSPVQVIGLVELPLALPVIIGGLRSATLQVVSTATLAAYVADVGLGRYLFTGLKSREYPLMLAGSLIVIGIALILELAWAAVQHLSRRVASPVARPRTSLH